jgi:broad specificity phosphatase PhoE
VEPQWPAHYCDGQQVGARVDRMISRSRAVKGDTAPFAHGHVLRVLAARLIGLAARAGSIFCRIGVPCLFSATTARYQLCGSGTGLSSARVQ